MSRRSNVQRLCNHFLDEPCLELECSKACTKCLNLKPLFSFHKEKLAPDGRRGVCKDCDKDRHDVYARQAHLRRTFKLTLDKYNEMLLAQNNNCCICKTSNPGKGRKWFPVDHDRECCSGNKSCGKCVRGLLCDRCNMGLGLFKNNKKLMAEAIRYLEKYE